MSTIKDLRELMNTRFDDVCKSIEFNSSVMQDLKSAISNLQAANNNLQVKCDTVLAENAELKKEVKVLKDDITELKQYLRRWFPTATTSTTSVFGAPVPSSSAGAFMFGAAKTEPVNSTPSNFAFGSGTTPSATASNFTGFQAPSQPASNMFQFGSQPSNNPAPAFGAASGGFSFGAKSDAPSQMAPASSSQAPAFGVPSQTMFGGATAPTFGGAAPAAASTPFVFGNTASSSGGSFSFGTPQQDSQNAGQFQAQPQFNISTPPTFNFGAASNQSSQPFQFAASSSAAPAEPSTGRRIRKAVRRGVRN
ncbi:hypothetical protein JTE90_012350 [Oedothorax gibbosus]|uniref:Nuclear pore complex protein n=1 Tax=Oedothorax gibbosus TaxID=931172 RepID=A0AAV6V6D5_9ARAC|nr:hypothetical protein JTE90_012350 [Oedothorax gibbosus]